MRKFLLVLAAACGAVTCATAQVSVAIGLPGVSIGINLPVYPELVRVPGYPVYYAPQVNSNYFFYDGMYWVYQRDNWYASSWYNGPWGLVAPDVVPVYVLRVPVRYYRRPPPYFVGWRADAPPRWGDHWGNSWQQTHRGWDDWNRRAVPPPAPLPVYQRQYSGSRYPQGERQYQLQSQQYRHQPQDVVVQQHYQAQRTQAAAPSRPVQQAAPQMQYQRQPSPQPAEPRAQQAPRAQSAAPQTPPGNGRDMSRQGRVNDPQPMQPSQGGGQRDQQTGKPQGQGGDRGSQGKESAPGQAEGHGRERGQ